MVYKCVSLLCLGIFVLGIMSITTVSASNTTAFQSSTSSVYQEDDNNSTTEPSESMGPVEGLGGFQSIVTNPNIGAGGLGPVITAPHPVVPPMSNPELKEPRCEPYNGSHCKNFVGNKYVYVPAGTTQTLLENKMKSALSVISHSQDISPGCERYALPSLCYSAFPLCWDDHTQYPRRICRQDCELLENELCKTEYAIAKRHPLIGKQLEMAECSQLPEVGSPESSGCLHLGIPHPEPINPEETCFWGVGESYRGTVSISQLGHECIPWSHQITVRTSEYPSVLGGHSHCRNPGGIEDRPWCFTVFKHHRELCDIPQCGNSSNTNASKSLMSNEDDQLDDCSCEAPENAKELYTIPESVFDSKDGFKEIVNNFETAQTLNTSLSEVRQMIRLQEIKVYRLVQLIADLELEVLKKKIKVLRKKKKKMVRRHRDVATNDSDDVDASSSATISENTTSYNGNKPNSCRCETSIGNKPKPLHRLSALPNNSKLNRTIVVSLSDIQRLLLLQELRVARLASSFANSRQKTFKKILQLLKQKKKKMRHSARVVCNDDAGNDADVEDNDEDDDAVEALQ